MIDAPGLRPSTDRIRETLFNWLGQDLSGLRCLDLFAGTGSLGFEAASRNAEATVLIERDKKTYANLLANFKLLQSSPAPGHVEIVHQDALEFLSRQPNLSSHLIFIDPPFQDANLLDRAVTLAGPICDDSSGGGIYIEGDGVFVSGQVLLEDSLIEGNVAISGNVNRVRQPSLLLLIKHKWPFRWRVLALHCVMSQMGADSTWKTTPRSLIMRWRPFPTAASSLTRRQVCVQCHCTSAMQQKPDHGSSCGQ